MKIEQLFDFETGSLPALEKVDDGEIPLVYGTSFNNGIIKYVSVDSDNDIFKPPLITVSYLGTAFVQVVPFTTSVVDKSNIIILRPKRKMEIEELYFYSYQINRTGKFGFHYGRRMNMARLKKIDMIPFEEDYRVKFKFADYLPEIPNKSEYKYISKHKLVPIEEVFEIKNAKSKGFNSYYEGEIPFVSNGILNNGIVGYITPNSSDRVFQKKGICLSAFCEATIHEPPFMPRGNGGSGLTILTPKPKYKFEHEDFLFYSAYLNLYCNWRFSYGRMVTINRVKKLKVPIQIE